MPSRKHLILFGLLALTLGAAFWVSDTAQPAIDQRVVQAAERVPKTRQDPTQPPPPDGQGPLSLYKLERASMIVSDANPFGSKTWSAPPPPPPPPPAAAPPSAPPLPFAFAGKLQGDAGHWIFYLTRGEQSFAVSPGDSFDNNNYRLDGIESGKLVIQYIPLSTKQFLVIAAES